MLKKILRNRVREASSYAGLSALLVLFGLPAEAGPLAQAVFDGITALAALTAILLPDRDPRIDSK